MTNAEAKQLILETCSHGEKAVDLVQKLARSEAGMILISTHSPTDVTDIIEEMVKEGMLIEIEYVLPTMEYRAKSFYLPKGTNVSIINNSFGEKA